MDELKPSVLFTKICKPIAVRWKPLGFPLSAGSAGSFSRFRFTIDTGAEYDERDSSSFDVKAGNIGFSCTFDPSRSNDPIQALDEAAWRAICEGPLAGRQFHAVPRETQTLLDFLDDESTDSIPVRLICNGDPVPGLYLSEEVRARSWNFFVDRETREGKILELARKLQREGRREHRNDNQKAREIVAISAQLTSALAAG